MGQQVVQLHDN